MVSLNRKVPLDETLAIHFQVCQPKTNTNGLSNFEVDYSFKRVRRFFNLFGKSIDGISNSLTFQIDNYRFGESFEIGTADLEAAAYDLEIEVKDLLTGEEMGRAVRFEIVE